MTVNFLGFYRSFGALWAFGLLGLVAIFAAQAQERDSFPTASPTVAEAKNVAAMEQPFNLRFEKAPLRTVVEDLRRELKINVEFDPEQLKEEGVDATKVLIDFQQKEATLQSFLKAALSEHGLTTVVSKDALNIVKVDSNSLPHKTVVYPVTDLASGNDDLRDVIESTITPKSWSRQGGSAEMEFHYPSEKIASLVVVQTEERHQKIRDLIRTLRKAKSLQAQSAEFSRGIPVQPLATAEVKLLAELEKPFNAIFEKASHHTVLDKLRREFDIPIEVDHQQIAEAEIDEKSLLITTHLKEIKLKNFLKIAFPSLAAIPMRDRIVISTSKFKFPKQVTVTVYPVADLVDWLQPASKKGEKTPDADELITLIVSSLFPERWDEIGGDGGIAFHLQSSCLVVLQDSEVHFAISNLLTTLRKASKLLVDPAITDTPNSPNIPTALCIDQPTAAEQRILDALQKPISATYSKAPLSEVLERIRKEFDINLHVDEKNIGDEVQPSKAMLVTCQLQEITLRSFLSTILQDHHLVLTIQNEALTITTQQSSLEIQITVVYPVEDLAMEADSSLFPEGAQVPQFDGPNLDFDSLIELITLSISPNCYDPSLFDFSSHHNSKTLIATLPDAAHREIRELFTALRHSRDVQGILRQAIQLDPAKGSRPAVKAKPAKDLPTVIPCEPITPASAKIEAAWQKTLSVHYQETPLSEVFDRLRKEFGINIHVCEQRLDDVGLDIAKRKITCDFEMITLRSFLDRLGKANGFKAVYFQEAIRITSYEDYEGSTWGIRVYPAFDLSEGDASEFYAVPLTELILSTVAPNSWEVFGPTPEFANVPTASLVISQSPDVHDEIANLLAALRKSRQAQEPKPEK